MLPVLFRLGPITLYSFGMLLAIAFLVSTFLIFREAKKEYLDEEKIFDVVFLSLISALVGSRLFYIIEHFDSFGFSILNWLLVNAKPGFSLWGGLGVGLAVFLLSIKKEKLPLFKMFNMMTVSLLLSLMLGYLGLFLAGGEIGTPTTLPWGVVFFSTLKRHPVSLYKVFASLLTLIILLRLNLVFRQKKIPAGSLFFSFIIIQSFLLFLIAFFKEDAIVIGRFFKLDHFIYLVLLLVSSVLLYKRLGRSFKGDLLLLKTKIRKITASKRGIHEKVSG